VSPGDHDLSWVRRVLEPKDAAFIIAIDGTTSAWKLREIVLALPYTAPMIERMLGKKHEHMLIVTERTALSAALNTVAAYGIAEPSLHKSVQALKAGRGADRYMWLFFCSTPTRRRLLSAIEKACEHVSAPVPLTPDAVRARA
jgi:hypothetical protein